jgi:hypothetical protein
MLMLGHLWGDIRGMATGCSMPITGWTSISCGTWRERMPALAADARRSASLGWFTTATSRATARP